MPSEQPSDVKLNFFAEPKRSDIHNKIRTADFADLHGLPQPVFNS